MLAVQQRGTSWTSAATALSTIFSVPPSADQFDEADEMLVDVFPVIWSMNGINASFKEPEEKRVFSSSPTKSKATLTPEHHACAGKNPLHAKAPPGLEPGHGGFAKRF